MNYFIKCMSSHYTTSSGRARRKEYLMFYLFSTLIKIVVGLMMGLLIPVKSPVIGIAFFILWFIFFIPYITVSFRRLHDTDRPGWLFFIPIINLYALIITLFIKGTEGTNRFGEDPLTE